MKICHREKSGKARVGRKRAGISVSVEKRQKKWLKAKTIAWACVGLAEIFKIAETAENGKPINWWCGFLSHSWLESFEKKHGKLKPRNSQYKSL